MGIRFVFGSTKDFAAWCEAQADDLDRRAATENRVARKKEYTAQARAHRDIAEVIRTSEFRSESTEREAY